MDMKQFYSAVVRFRGRLHTGQIPRRFCSGLSKQTESQEIIIPPRIERGPTDILRALASTISRDLTAPHYKYHDDPYLIPSSNIGKRTFALAKESGRKAAQWIQQQNPKLFEQDLAEPPIPALMPRAVYGEGSVVSETDLRHLVDCARVTDVIKVWELLETQGQTVTMETKQAMLELLCFYNAEESLSEDLVEERWFKAGQRRERQRKTWKDGGLAESVFASIKTELEGQENSGPQLNKAKCTLIRGMAKFCQVDKAWDMFQTMRTNDEKVDAGTYESLIRASSFLRDGNEARWQLVEEILKDMAKTKVAPSLATLNAVLEALSTTGGWRQGRNLALRVLTEFKQLGINPSLASYYFLLSIFCRERGPMSLILEEILTELETKNEPLTIQDTKDTFFFVTAMDVCRNHLGDPSLARRLHKLLHAHNNYDLIGDSYKESIYYRHFFTVLCTMEPLDSFIAVYDTYVPNVYIPEPSVMEEIVRAVELHEAWDQLPRLWSDIVLFDQIDREMLVTRWLFAAVLANVKSNPILSIDESTEPTPPVASTNQNERPVINNEVLAALINQIARDDLASALCRSAAQLWEKIENQPSYKTNVMKWNGPMLGYVMRLALRAEEFPFACQILDKLRSGIIIGAPPELESLRDFLTAVAERQDAEKAMSCLEYLIDAGFPEAAILTTELREKMTLSTNQNDKLDALLGRS